MRKVFAVAAFAALIVATMIGTISGTITGLGAYKEQRLLVTTVQMERLATKLEHARKIAPETKLEVTRLTLDPLSDCAQAGCRTKLELRNRAARERLQMLVTHGAAFAEPSVGR
jgi:hypothetical protein